LIHRDIKPSNILVSTQDDKPVAKVIDFGIAKATQARLTEKTLFTEFQQLIGTPEYMSPEQAGGSLDIDTRTDVYSLGVLLYELLVGAPPFDARELRSKAYAEMQRIIKEVDPPAPSTRLSTLEALPSVAVQRGTEPRKLSVSIRGELDWIVMKALEKDRARRYESASALAADIRHHLADEPVSAGPPSRVYRLRKFVRRHRIGVFGSALIVLLLIAGITGTTIGLLEARKQRDAARRQEEQAKQQAAIAQAVSQFQSDMLSSADPDKLLGDKVTVLQAVAAAERELEAGKLKDQPQVEAGVRQTIGVTLRELNRTNQAEHHFRRMLELHRSDPGLDQARRAADLNYLATALWPHNKRTELIEQSKRTEAIQLRREALEIWRQMRPVPHLELVAAMSALGVSLAFEGRFAEAEPLLREAVAHAQANLPADNRERASAVNNLAMMLRDQGKRDEAEAMFREALSLTRSTLPEGHPWIASAQLNLARLLVTRGKLDEAETLFRGALEIRRKTLPPDHPDISICLDELASLLRSRRKHAEAEPMLREAVEIRRRAFGPTDAETLKATSNLAFLLDAQGKFTESEPLFRQLVAANSPGFAGWRTGNVRMGLGHTLTGLKQYAQAEPMLLEAEQILATAPQTPAGRHNQSMRSLAELYTAWNKAEPGKGYDQKALQWQVKVPATQPATTQATTRQIN
jgi:tetratricopeptide (TPR) repeat protein